MANIGERITEGVFREVRDAIPEGVRCCDLVRRVLELAGTFRSNTVHGNVWNLDGAFLIAFTSRPAAFTD